MGGLSILPLLVPFFLFFFKKGVIGEILILLPSEFASMLHSSPPPLIFYVRQCRALLIFLHCDLRIPSALLPSSCGLGTFGVDVVVVLLVVSDSGVPVGGGGVGAVAVGGLGGEVVCAGAL